jgi:pimeloyl-ACP methyl ester carboxylesterase
VGRARQDAGAPASLAAHSHWWDWTAPLLAERFSVVALDLRGANPSEAGSRYRLCPPETKAPGDWIRHLGGAAVVERNTGVWHYAVDRRVFAHARPDACGTT